MVYYVAWPHSYMLFIMLNILTACPLRAVLFITFGVVMTYSNKYYLSPCVVPIWHHRLGLHLNFHLAIVII